MRESRYTDEYDSCYEAISLRYQSGICVALKKSSHDVQLLLKQFDMLADINETSARRQHIDTVLLSLDFFIDNADQEFADALFAAEAVKEIILRKWFDDTLSVKARERDAFEFLLHKTETENYLADIADYQRQYQEHEKIQWKLNSLKNITFPEALIRVQHLFDEKLKALEEKIKPLPNIAQLQIVSLQQMFYEEKLEALEKISVIKRDVFLTEDIFVPPIIHEAIVEFAPEDRTMQLQTLLSLEQKLISIQQAIARLQEERNVIIREEHVKDIQKQLKKNIDFQTALKKIKQTRKEYNELSGTITANHEFLMSFIEPYHNVEIMLGELAQQLAAQMQIEYTNYLDRAKQSANFSIYMRSALADCTASIKKFQKLSENSALDKNIKNIAQVKIASIDQYCGALTTILEDWTTETVSVVMAEMRTLTESRLATWRELHEEATYARSFTSICKNKVADDVLEELQDVLTRQQKVEEQFLQDLVSKPAYEFSAVLHEKKKQDFQFGEYCEQRLWHLKENTSASRKVGEFIWKFFKTIGCTWLWRDNTSRRKKAKSYLTTAMRVSEYPGAFLNCHLQQQAQMDNAVQDKGFFPEYIC